jgi:hypothetical protein
LTAEIGILNKTGVALAADSAVTIGNGLKIYNSANKLFSLSKFHPVGIMIYGNAGFMNIPWETLIKVYRQKLGDQSFSTLEDYSQNFIDFLKNDTYAELKSTFEQDSNIRFIVELNTESLRDRVIEQLNSILENIEEDIDQPTIEKYFINVLESEIDEEYNFLESEAYLTEFTEEDFNTLQATYNDYIYEVIQDKFENTPLDKSLYEKISYINIFSLLKEFSPGKSGLVIAGFGEDEIYPSLFSYHIEGKINNKLKIQIDEITKIGENGAASAILPFAQSEMVHTFIGGIDPEIKSISDLFVKNALSDFPQKIIDELDRHSVLTKEQGNDILVALKEYSNNLYSEYINIIKRHQNENYISPIISIVRNLPKDELAEMAESLVNLTSFKRRVSSSHETVGGPVDVAVITKGDGFIWIKRKHYFQSELNQQFFQKYLRSGNFDPTTYQK